MSIKRHFLDLDASVLFYVMKSCNMIKGSLSDFQALSMDHFRAIFKLDQIKVSKKIVIKSEGVIIQSDGVSASVHFCSYKVEKSDLPPKQHKDYERVIAIDPGRVNLAMGIEKLKNGKFKKHQLTRKCYYQKAGFNQARRLTSKWNNAERDKWEIFSVYSPKT